MNNPPLLIFAKSPIPGKVKTRLMSHCTAEQAASIAKILLEATLQLSTKVWAGPVFLSTWPDASNSTIQALAKQYDVPVAIQCQGDLGVKMLHGLEENGYPAAILGSDACAIEPSILQTAHEVLMDGGNVIGPSADGGYYLIGLNQSQPALFKNMPWGTEKVLEETLKKQSVDQPLTLLPEGYDIDTWQDVMRARNHLPKLDDFLAENALQP